MQGYNNNANDEEDNNAPVPMHWHVLCSQSCAGFR